MQQVQDARKNPALQVIKEQGTGAFNVQFNTSVPPLNDVRVRQALAYAIDRAAERKVIYSDEAEMATSLWGKGSPWHCDNAVYPDYDPAKAQSLLKDYGKPVKLTLQVPALSNRSSHRRALSELVEESRCRDRDRAGPDWTRPISARSLRENTKLSFGICRICPILTSKSMPCCIPAAGPTSVASMTPCLDAALERGRVSMDPAVRKSAYCDVAKEMNKFVPVLLRNQHDYYAMANAKLRGVTHLRFGRFWPAEAWWEK